ncbi:hypothetical protein [Streptomyces sp. 1331.2]|uniref:hypothetical protein n=1 Tax=Streptomyces sp. 1331.2 TaxID=1938835 RepID=UPI000BCE631D|nr:hypothetical protein [Streptomyces sp. 1331.2]SOB84095.1 hypothetical protein SAMN06272789_4330 [Streptomyces sp. 1331.2]
MSEPKEFEDDLLYALTRTGEGFRAGQAEQADLVAGGYRRGRRRWRRRSTAAVVGGAAALALVGTGAVYLTGASGAKGAGTVSAASAPTTTAGAGPAATPTTVKSSAPTVITGDEVLATFQALLPKGETTDGKGRGTDDDRTGGTFVGADVVFDDGQGKSLVQIGIQKHRPNQGQPRSCPKDFKLARVDSCSVTTLPDGSQLMLQQGHEYSDGRADTKAWIASLSGPDGRDINLSEWNAPAEKGARDSRPNPPLTFDQLKAIVTDKSWDRTVAAVKFDGIDTDAIDPGLSLPDREAVLAGLLPPGVTVTDRSGSALTATFRLGQGQEAGSLVLRVENWAKSVDNPAQQAFKDAVVLPDGNKVLVLGGPDSKDKQPLRVTVLHPDGMEVVAAQGPTGRQLLTAEQLKAIATSPAWKAKK